MTWHVCGHITYEIRTQGGLGDQVLVIESQFIFSAAQRDTVLKTIRLNIARRIRHTHLAGSITLILDTYQNSSPALGLRNLEHAYR